MATQKQLKRERNVRAQKGSRSGSNSAERDKFYRIEIRPQSDFSAFRTEQVESGQVERVSGKRPSGNWATAAWLVRKEDAHVENGELVIDDKQVRNSLRQLRGAITKVRGHIFSAQTTSPNKKKLTPAQKTARQENIRKAQAARWKKK